MTGMIEVKTAELIGPALDWAVAKAAEWPVEIKAIGTVSSASTGHKARATGYRLWMVSDTEPKECMPTEDWSQGGPLIHKFQVGLLSPKQSPCGEWHASTLHPDFTDFTHKDNPLIAAMRAIVALRLGDAVAVPSGLVS